MSSVHIRKLIAGIWYIVYIDQKQRRSKYGSSCECISSQNTFITLDENVYGLLNSFS